MAVPQGGNEEVGTGILVIREPGVLTVRNPMVGLLCAAFRELCTGKICALSAVVTRDACEPIDGRASGRG